MCAYGDPRTHWSLTSPFAGEGATWAAENRAHHPGGKLSCTGRGGLITSKLADLITLNRSRGVFFKNNGTTHNMSQESSEEEDFLNTVAVLPQIDTSSCKIYSRAHVTFELGSTKVEALWKLWSTDTESESSINDLFKNWDTCQAGSCHLVGVASVPQTIWGGK